MIYNTINSIKNTKINKINVVIGTLKNDNVFNGRLNKHYLNVIPLLNSIFQMKYKIMLNYELYDVNNIFIKNNNKIYVKSSKTIDYKINNNYLILYNQENTKPLIEFNCMKNYYNVKEYKSLIWSFDDEEINIICKVFQDYINIELQINNKKKLYKAEKILNIFDKILSQLELNNNE